MTSLAESTRLRTAARPELTRGALRFAPWVAGVLAGLVRLGWADGRLGSDEAGFLVVAHQWAPGSSLYGDYWVDRPPLLISLFRMADGLGGPVGLWAVGAVAVLVAVVALSAAVRRAIGSPVAAAWSALTAAVLLASPVAGASQVNGELLAAPFTALGVLGVVLVWRSTGRWSRLAGAALAGAGVVAAVLVKQNMVDVLVVAAGAVLVGLVRRRLRVRTLLPLVVAGAFGGVVVVGLVLAWAALHGTSPGDIWWAMYPFRVEAGRVLASSPGTAAHERTVELARDAVASGLVPAVILVGAGARRFRGDTAAAVLVVLGWTAWVVVSIVVSGNAWSHYLVQAALPVAVGVGLLSTVRPRIAALAAIVCVVPAVISATAVMTRTSPLTYDQQVGRAIGAVSEPTDSLVVTWGHPGVVRASGLTSPYPSLWSLPTKTLDPDLVEWTALLAGRRAPTWVVTRPSLRSWGLSTDAASAVLDQRYRRVADMCGYHVYLRDGLDRPVPAATCG